MITWWLRSAVGEREKWSGGGETAGTEPERNAVAEPPTEAHATAVFLQMPLVTSARICEVERASSKGNRATSKPVERSEPRVGHGDSVRLHGIDVTVKLHFTPWQHNETIGTFGGVDELRTGINQL